MDRQNSTLARGENRKCVREGEKVGTRGGGDLTRGTNIKKSEMNNAIII